MLADAGYPNGFTIKLPVQSTPYDQDHAALLKDQWAKIGVTVELETGNQIAVWERLKSGKWSGASIAEVEYVNPVSTVAMIGKSFEKGGWINMGRYSNPEVDAMIDRAANTLDPAEAVPIINVYFLAARAVGVPTRQILFRHVLPNIMAPMIVIFTVTIGDVIIAEASLSFLGYGLPLSVASWGGCSVGKDADTWRGSRRWLSGPGFPCASLSGAPTCSATR